MSETGPQVGWLNDLREQDAQSELLKCCGSVAWSTQVAQCRPFEHYGELISRATNIWWGLQSADWLEAFRSHPRIGEKNAEANTSAQANSWSAQEQSAIATAREQTLAELAKLNQAYEEKFGFIYIVCATGKSSEEMLALLKSRMENLPNDELRIAATEQAKITEIRLKKLCSVVPG